MEHLAALSHEFRTPLHGVIGMARLLETTPLSAEQRSYVEALIESGDHLLGLVNDVLDYARLGGGAARLDEAPIAVEALLGSICESASPKAHEKNLEIGWTVAAMAPIISTDEGRLRQILLNFVGNAIKATDRGGVLVSARPALGGRVRFEVADTGPGVPAPQRSRIFEAFTQLEENPGLESTGAGLGLAIATRIAESLGGTVGIEESEWGGAQFWFEAPVAIRDPPSKSRPLASRRVAILSPNPIVRVSAAGMVQASGGEPSSTAWGDELSLRDGRIDVVLVDRSCAGDSGIPEPPTEAPSVLLIRPEERGAISRARRGGFDGYLIKPLRRASMTERILAALGGGDSGAAQDDERISPAADGAAAPAAIGAQILLAEDDPVGARLAAALLTKEGCVVDRVANGEEAVEAALRVSYDLVFMDVRMPRMNGLDAVRTLRARGMTTPIIALTAGAFDEERRACLAAGMDDVLVKPLSLKALRDAVSRWIKGRWTGERGGRKLAS
ncbi:MAG: response regulator [Caulobacteraceae bacterium]